MAKVYRLSNETRKERYYGKTSGEVKKRVIAHEAGKTKALSKWNFSKNKILTKTIGKGLTEKKATKNAHRLEKRKPPPGWKIIQTGGP